jgi:outer membrane protein assembly factor BamB
VAWRLTPEKAERLWATPCPKVSVELSSPAVNDKYVYIGGAFGPGNPEMQVLDLQTGKVLATVSGCGPGNEGHIFTVENLVIVSVDGSHGHSEMGFFGSTPETFKFLGIWDQPHPQTTSYHLKCTTFPLVEGRIFIRGYDGIYCYDLRAMR